MKAETVNPFRLFLRILTQMTFCVFFYSFERSVADNVFHLAGVIYSGFFVYANSAEELCDKSVALKHLLGNFLAEVCEKKETVLIGNNVAAAFQKAHGAAYAGFGITHVFAYVDGADGTAFFTENVYCFQIHLAGFL